MRLFRKKTHNQNSFKRLIHRLSAMTESELIKVEQLLDVVFDSKEKKVVLTDSTHSNSIPQDQTLDETINEVKNKLNKEQLEKRIEEFKQAKKPQNG
ncbi:hypothetical protein [Streptococcus constellatus]|uniref:hypothetical protein n=1 Tax=Streptococcus constellatus TaxID=76860 RepID=UPI00066074CE|nr:hypothetical protein [Streptococcus constellatus]